MKYRLLLRIGSVLVLGFCLGVTGCARAPAEAPAAAPIPVTVSYPVDQYVTDYADFTARVAAVDAVEVRAVSEAALNEGGTMVVNGSGIGFLLSGRCLKCSFESPLYWFLLGNSGLALAARGQ